MQPTECCQFVQIYRASQAAQRSVCRSVRLPVSPACLSGLSLPWPVHHYIQGRNAKTALLTIATGTDWLKVLASVVVGS